MSSEDAPKKREKPKNLHARTVTREQLREVRVSPPVLDPVKEAYARCRAMGMSVEEAGLAIGGKFQPNTLKNWERESDLLRDRIAELSTLANKNAILKTGLDRQWVIERLMSVVERCMQAEEVFDKKGNPTGQYKFDSMGANQALKMLGDTLGLFRPVEKKPGDDYAELTDDEIARIARELAAQTGLLAIDAGTQEAAGPEQVGEVQALPPPA